MSQSISEPNGAVVLGLRTRPEAEVSPVFLGAGSIIRSAVLAVPKQAGVLSFEVSVTPTSPGTSAAVVIRAGNREDALLPAPSAAPVSDELDDFSTPQHLLYSTEAMSNYVQFEISADRDCWIWVVAGAR